MELMEHLDELRSRLIRAVLYLFGGSAISWFIYPHLFNLFIHPILPILAAHHIKLVFRHFTEGFFLQMQVSVISGFSLASPFLLWELWGFISPALTAQEKRPMRWVFPLALSLFAGGVTLAYFIMTKCVEWFLSYVPVGVEMLQDLGVYLLFLVKMCLAFGLAFELPVLLMFLAKIGLVNSASMRQYWRQAVVGIMLGAAILTPSNDPFSMIMMAVPMGLLYLASIWLVKFVE